MKKSASNQPSLATASVLGQPPRSLSENSKTNDFAKLNPLFIKGLKIQFFEKSSFRTASQWQPMALLSTIQYPVYWF
ncbi:Uncharacterised protein [Candidatus Venteria ishoeyi]|uniref:Uncharacterized protein n=1 Tax=Candidatus Venteria ishoeyi TaxID=1899563 RepID=A0A1H6FGW7_9GAMM|nr:Uncharacterised protein [Candidatus Venteria ishoeyi]